MFKIEIKGNFKKASEKIRNTLKRAPRNVKGRLKELADEIIRRLKIPGKKPTYPINWDSDKQRRAFFATNGFGGGIPHKRTGKTARGWTRQETQRGFTVMNKVKGSKYVWGTPGGEDQSSIHQGRWTLLRDIIERVISKLPKVIREAMMDI